MQQPQMQQIPNPHPLQLDPENNEEPDFEMTEAQREAEKTMSDEQRKRFDLLTNGTATKIPKSKVKEIISAVLPPNSRIPESVAHVTSIATKLFVAELVETSKQFHTGRGPLLPEDIMLAFRKLEEEGKIPGKSSGHRRQYMK